MRHNIIDLTKDSDEELSLPNKQITVIDLTLDPDEDLIKNPIKKSVVVIDLTLDSESEDDSIKKPITINPAKQITEINTIMDDINKLIIGCENINIKNYTGTRVVYLAYIGIHRGKYLLKFGISSDYYRRETKEHKYTYPVYKLIRLWTSVSNDSVEKQIKQEMRYRKVLTSEKFNGSNKKELIALNDYFTASKCVEIIDKFVKNTKSKEELVCENLMKEVDELKKKLSELTIE
jgi:hypothetical protein